MNRPLVRVVVPVSSGERNRRERRASPAIVPRLSLRGRMDDEPEPHDIARSRAGGRRAIEASIDRPGAGRAPHG